MSRETRARVCVVGSINMDLVMRTPRFPLAGETLLGGPFQKHPGGKGANQAVAAARCGAHVDMIGCVGADEFGAIMRDTLRNEGIGVEHVTSIDGAHTGVAQITVDAAGENWIIVAPGANYQVGEPLLAEDAIARAGVLLAQLEIPMQAFVRAATIAKASGVRVILNAAPAAALPADLSSLVDVLVVNQREAAAISACPPESSLYEVSGALRMLGFRTIVITLGADGACVLHDDEQHHVKAARIEAVDTVGAGDAFTGALAASLAHDDNMLRAVRMASAAGAIAATRHGAIPSLPYADEVKKLAATLA